MVRLAVLAGCLVGPVLALTNLLTNPGFEEWLSDSQPSGWTVEARNTTRVLREFDTVHSGSASARLIRLVTGTGNNKGIWQRVPVQPGQAYVCSVRCLDDLDSIRLGLVITWRAADTGYISSEPVRYSVNQPGWQAVAATDTAPESAAFADFIVRTYGASGSPAGLRVIADDAALAVPETQAETTRLWFVSDSLGQRLVAFFDSARSSIDYCCWNSSRTDVTLALIRAHTRGVRVRVATDDTRLGNPWVEFLRGSGVMVWSDSVSRNRSLYMHDKFAVRDAGDPDTIRHWMWCGSYNANAGEVHADYALEIPSPALCRAYLAEFNQMWGSAGPVPVAESARFHTDKQFVDPGPLTVEGFPAFLYFGPTTPLVDTVSALVGRSESEVLFAINSFTYDPLADSMLVARDRGVSVAGTFDKAGALDPYSEYPRLRSWHIPVLIDSVRHGSGVLHEKLMVIDSGLAVTGSANWSTNGNSNNDENTLILSAPALVLRFHAEVLARYLEAGGTYPPGIFEPERRPRPPVATFGPTPGRSLAGLPASCRVYDAAGRRVTPELPPGPGVYLVVPAGRAAGSVVVVR